MSSETVILTPLETSQRVKKTRGTLAIMRFQAGQLTRAKKPIPPHLALRWCYVGRRVFYREIDVEKYLASLKPAFVMQPRKAQLPSPGRPRKKQRRAA